MQLDLKATPLSVPDTSAVSACSETVYKLHWENRLGKSKNAKGRKESSLVMVCGRPRATFQCRVARQNALMLKDLQHFTNSEEWKIPLRDLQSEGSSSLKSLSSHCLQGEWALQPKNIRSGQQAQFPASLCGSARDTLPFQCASVLYTDLARFFTSSLFVDAWEANHISGESTGELVENHPIHGIRCPLA